MHVHKCVCVCVYVCVCVCVFVFVNEEWVEEVDSLGLEPHKIHDKNMAILLYILNFFILKGFYDRLTLLDLFCFIQLYGPFHFFIPRNNSCVLKLR